MIYSIKRYSIAIAFFYSMTIGAQIAVNGDYLGVLKISNGVTITYSIEFSCINATCNGFSVVDSGGPNETKSELIGTIDFLENKVFFKEINVVYTKAQAESYNEICLLTFDFGLDKLISERNQELMGQFKGVFPDNTLCLEGLIQLKSRESLAQEVDKLIDKLDTKLARRALGDSTITVIKSQLDSIPELNKRGGAMSVEKNISYDAYNQLYLKDLGNNDGDIIEIIQEGDTVEINLTKKPYQLQNKRNNKIKVIGIDEGKYPTIPLEFIIKRFKDIKFRDVLILRKNDTVTYLVGSQ
jgi:hypothetical protein